MADHEEFLARHPKAEHPYLAAVHDGMASGYCSGQSSASEIACDELLTIYARRAEHLARFNAPHATALQRDVLEFCQRLESARGALARWWTFRAPGGVQYEFVEHVGTQQLLGTLQTISKLDVEPEEWARIWSR